MDRLRNNLICGVRLGKADTLVGHRNTRSGGLFSWPPRHAYRIGRRPGTSCRLSDCEYGPLPGGPFYCGGVGWWPSSYAGADLIWLAKRRESAWFESIPSLSSLFYWPTGRATPTGNVRISRGSQKEGDLRPLALDPAHLLSESMRDPVPIGIPSRGKRAPLTLDKPGQRRRHRIDGGTNGV